MDAKQKLESYICGKRWMLITGGIMLVVGIATLTLGVGVLLLTLGFFFGLLGLCVDLPVKSRTKRSLERLAFSGQLERAAAELESPNRLEVAKGAVILTENYLFCKHTGVALALTDIVWVYKHRMTQSVFFIPIYSQDSLMVGDGIKNPIQAINLGRKDKHEELHAIILAIYQKNPRVMIGYNAENQKAYKAIRKQKV